MENGAFFLILRHVYINSSNLILQLKQSHSSAAALAALRSTERSRS